jgi:HAD superfamily hydrolase (TIGR01509 family)
VLAGIGIPITEQEIAHRFTGIRHTDMIRALERETGIRTPEDLTDRVRAALRRALAAEGDGLAVPGIHEALVGLGDRRRCVASGSPPEALEFMLSQIRLWEHFAPHVYSSVGLERGKPAPDVFLHAASALDVAPERCLVIEDSVPGVTAGIAAGMTVLGFAGSAASPARQAERLAAAGAHETFAEMRRLPHYVGALEAR